MQRVRFTHRMGYYEPGEVHVLGDQIAKRAIWLGRAEPAPRGEVETATRQPPENAATRTHRPEEEPALCGAEKAGGGYCTRKVQGGGRCWQHDDN